MKIIITGATGMVGKGALLEAVDNPEVTQILLINRSPIGKEYPKVKEVIHKDFFNFEAFAEEFISYDACFFCLGISSIGMSEADYKRITYDVTLAAAEVMHKANPVMTFIYVSGTGTSTKEKGSIWARVKGKTENDIIKLGFKQAFMFRPGYIQPLRGIKSKVKWYQGMYDVFGWLYPMLTKIFPNHITDTTRVGKAMLSVTKKGFEQLHLENRHINLAAGN